MKKKIVLITGSEGFLAKNFINKFIKKYTFIKFDKKINGHLSLKKKLNKNGVIFDFWSSFKEVDTKKNYFGLGEGKINQ